MQEKANKIELNIHASALYIEGYGVLIRGKSGSGKSLLALELIDNITKFKTTLIADDRVNISKENNEVFLHYVPSLKAKIELFGYGIVKREYIKSAKLDLIIDLVDEIVRMPEKKEFSCVFLGEKIARCPIPNSKLTNINHQILLISEAILALKRAKL